MTKLLLSIHVLAAIIAIGPVAVAASMFPAALRRTAGNRAAAAAGSGRGDAGGAAAAARSADLGLAVTRPPHRSDSRPAGPPDRDEAGSAIPPDPGDTGGEPASSLDPHSAERDLAVLRNLHRICQVYAAVGIVVPVFGLATASSLGVLTDPWLLISIALTIAAAGVLVLLVLPGQRDALANGNTASAPRLAMYTGVFNLLWAVVTVLMITRPGSTTGA